MTLKDAGILLALLTVAAVAGDPLSDYVLGVYDRAYPVVTMRATTMRLEDGRFGITMSGTKHRDCELQSVWAYDVSPIGSRVRLAAARMDGAELATHPPGKFSSGVPWIITPPPAGTLEIWLSHLCGTRKVLTQLTVE